MSDAIDRLVRQFGDKGLETTIEIENRAYRVYAYPSAGGSGKRVRWNLYEADASGSRLVRGLTFGIAESAHAAFEDVLEAARRHAQTGAAEPRAPRTFRPAPED